MWWPIWDLFWIFGIFGITRFIEWCPHWGNNVARSENGIGDGWSSNRSNVRECDEYIITFFTQMFYWDATLISMCIALLISFKSPDHYLSIGTKLVGIWRKKISPYNWVASWRHQPMTSQYAMYRKGTQRISFGYSLLANKYYMLSHQNGQNRFGPTRCPQERIEFGFPSYDRCESIPAVLML